MKKMKLEKYEAPEMEVVLFESGDIITASGGGGTITDPDAGDGEDL